VGMVADRRWTARLVVAAMALTMLAAACAKDNGPAAGGSSSGSGATTGSGSGSGGSTAGGSGYGSGGYSRNSGGGSTSSGGGASVQTVSQANFSFSPSTFSVKSGDTITVKNTTTDKQHTFTITGQTVDVTLDPSTSQKVKISLPAGTYPFICRFHASQGMTGTLTVT
jgi:plastocyanin